jgi:hypothetical protein
VEWGLLGDSAMKLAVALLLALLAGTSHADHQKLTINELAVLDRQGAWQEVLAHLEDIVPSQRDATWRGIAEHAGVGYLRGLDPRDALEFSDHFLAEFPLMAQSRPFMTTRVATAFPAFEACFKDGRGAMACADRLVPFVDADPADTSLVMRAARLVGASAAKDRAVAFFARALAARIRICGEDTLAGSVTAALALPPGDALVTDARAIAKDVCWDALKEALVDRFIADSSSSYRKNTCDFLSAKNALSTISLKRCASLAKTTK